MAVCNLFNTFRNPSGNFMMFSQYVEDITKNLTEGDVNYRVIPTKYVALNIDYSKVDPQLVFPNDDLDLNVCIPKYFQNVFENGCAYLRSKEDFDWSPEISKNLFWNCMFDAKFLHHYTDDKLEIVEEMMYVGDINMQSYNEHAGMGYGEIYCYIPTDAAKTNTFVYDIIDDKVFYGNDDKNLVGYKDKYTENYIQKYYYEKNYSFSFENDSKMSSAINKNYNKYDINTFVILYDVYVNDVCIHSDIPMGMYVTGMFEEDRLTNIVNKYVTTSYGTGTSYGLRICTRFTASPNGSYVSEIISDNTDYTSICQLMTGMNENLSKMLDISKSAIDTTQQYKDLLSILKNNRTNVPYIKKVNGKDCWFVNGKYVSTVTGNVDDNCCVELANETIEMRIANIEDGNKDNDFDYIKDPNGCDCFPWSNSALAEEIDKIDENFEYSYDGPDYGGGTTGGNGIPGEECSCKLKLAEDGSVAEYLNNN